MESAMGRPPIGKIAMTGAERVARYRRKHQPVTKPVTKQSGADASKATKRLEARIKELEAALAREQERREAAEAKAAVSNAEATVMLEARIRELEEIEERGWRVARRGIKFSSHDYRLLKSILHPDAVADPALKKKHEHAFKIFTDQLPEAMFREKKLDPNKPAPKKPTPMPETAAEWNAAKQRATAERKRKRAEGKARKTARKLARP
jgi:hypothetical protein